MNNRQALMKFKKNTCKKINQKRKLLVELIVETPTGWITVPVVFFLQQTMQTTAIMTHKTMRPMIPPTTAPMIVPMGLKENQSYMYKSDFP